MKTIVDFYNQYNEESRLRRHPVEYYVTSFVLDKIIEQNDLVLDIGAGTGIYSIYLASKGNEVYAEDIVPRHITLLNEKLNKSQKAKIHTRVNDARDLSEYKNGYFNSVLYLGPSYHLSDKDLATSIMDVIRVLKAKGTIILSYINKYHGYENDKYKEEFFFRTKSEMQTIIGDSELTLEAHIPTDGSLYKEFQTIITDQYHEGDVQNWLERNIKISNSRIQDDFVHALIIYRKRST